MMASFDGDHKVDEDQHDRYHIKKVGKFWLMKINGKPLRIKFLDHAKEVYIEETFLIADDKLFEIQVNDHGEVSFLRVEDFSHAPKEFEHSTKDLKTNENNLNEVGSTSIKRAIKIESNISDENYDDEDCRICMDTKTDQKMLKCGHSFCSECIEAQFKSKKACPTCGQVYGIITGDQPEGYMNHTVDRYPDCSGFEGCGRITITYNFPSGRQGPNHPNPGTFYKGITRIAYFPNNKEGRKIFAMLKVAFKRSWYLQ